jgi:hypothetical protein
MANSNGMMPICSISASEPTYARPGTSQSYPPLNTKSMYPSTWTTVPYPEEASPAEPYGLEQPTSYMSNDNPVTNSSLYEPSCRWTYPTSRPFQQATNVYYDQDPYFNIHGMPYTPNKSRVTVTSEPHSPMNMSSLNLSLPSRPHPRQYCATDGVARQLPFPQQNPAQTSRNAVDNLQDQRLRSSQGSSTSFMRPLQPWNSNSESLSNVTTTAPVDNSTIVVTTEESALSFLATTAIESDTCVNGTVTSPELNFSSSLLETITAPAPNSKYSNFRESRAQGRQPGHITRHDSQTKLYSYNAENTSKCDSLCEENSNDRKLVNGRQYVPLAHQQAQGSSIPKSLQRESFEDRNSTLQCASMGSLNTSF